MITQTKYRILLWLVLILLALNGATIASLIFHTRQSEKEGTVQKTAEPAAPKNEQGARFFREQLNLDTAQTRHFREINREYNRSTNMIARDLELLRIEMVGQMGKDDPDTVRLKRISREIGDYHEQLKNLTIDYYLKMKRVCNEDQQQKLNSIFNGMVQKEEPVSGHQGRGRGYQWRWGRK